jgi:hypothetical protein
MRERLAPHRARLIKGAVVVALACSVGSVFAHGLARTLLIVLAVVLAVAGGATAVSAKQANLIFTLAIAVISLGLDVSDAFHGPQAIPTARPYTVPSTTAPSAKPTPLSPNPNASCKDFELSSGTPTTPYLVDSPGQLAGGEGILEGKVMPGGSWGNVLHVAKGTELQFSLELMDPMYGSVEDASILVAIPTDSNTCWKVTSTATWSGVDLYRPSTGGPVFVALARHATAHLRYVSGSTELLNYKGKLIAKLGDGIATQGIYIPYEIPPAEPTGVGVRFVNFFVRVT